MIHNIKSYETNYQGQKKDKSSKIQMQTKSFGIIEVDTEDIISFPEGILAFEHLDSYIMLDTRKGQSFKWLQSMAEPNIAFLIVNPYDLIPDYNPILSNEALSIVQTSKHVELLAYCIVTIPATKPNDLTVNLQGPIMINPKEKLAAQFIGESDSYSIREPLMPLMQRLAGM